MKVSNAKKYAIYKRMKRFFSYSVELEIVVLRVKIAPIEMDFYDCPITIELFESYTHVNGWNRYRNREITFENIVFEVYFVNTPRHWKGFSLCMYDPNHKRYHIPK